jgi:hypothetical protein
MEPAQPLFIVKLPWLTLGEIFEAIGFEAIGLEAM